MALDLHLTSDQGYKTDFLQEAQVVIAWTTMGPDLPILGLADELSSHYDPVTSFSLRDKPATLILPHLHDICFSALSRTPFEFHDGNPLQDISPTDYCNLVLATFPQNLELILEILEEDGDEGLEREASTTTADKAFDSQEDDDWIWEDETDILQDSKTPTSSWFS